MSVKLNALNSDSHIDISQYRDQHFKVSQKNTSDEHITECFNVNITVCVVSLQLAAVD